MESDVYNSDKQIIKYSKDDPITRPVQTKASVKFSKYPFQFVTFRETFRLGANRTNNKVRKEREKGEETVVPLKKKSCVNNDSICYNLEHAYKRKGKRKSEDKNSNDTSTCEEQGRAIEESVLACFDETEVLATSPKKKKIEKHTLSSSPEKEEQQSSQKEKRLFFRKEDNKKVVLPSTEENEEKLPLPQKNSGKINVSPAHEDKELLLREEDTEENVCPFTGEIEENCALSFLTITNADDDLCCHVTKRRKIVDEERTVKYSKKFHKKRKNTENSVAITPIEENNEKILFEENVCPLTGEIEENCALSFLTDKNIAENQKAGNDLNLHLKKQKVNEEKTVSSEKKQENPAEFKEESSSLSTKNRKKIKKKRKGVESAVIDNLTNQTEDLLDSGKKIENFNISSNERRNEEEQLLSIRKENEVSSLTEEIEENCSLRQEKTNINKQSSLAPAKDKNEEHQENNPQIEERVLSFDEGQTQSNKVLLSKRVENGIILPLTEEHVNKAGDLHTKKKSEERNVGVIQIQQAESIVPQERKNGEKTTEENRQISESSRSERSISPDFPICRHNLSASEISWLVRRDKRGVKRKEEMRDIEENKPKKKIPEDCGNTVDDGKNTKETIVLLLKKYMKKLKIKTLDQNEEPDSTTENSFKIQSEVVASAETTATQNEELNNSQTHQQSSKDSEPTNQVSSSENNQIGENNAVVQSKDKAVSDDEETEEEESNEESITSDEGENGLCENTIKKLKSLSIEITWEVPKLHTIETRVSAGPKAEQKEELKRLEIQIKSGIFSKLEDEQIEKNWEEFCRLHNLQQDPTPFADFSCVQGFPLLPTLERIKFVRFLAHGLDNRLLHSVYRRFQKLVLNKDIKRGRFTEEEDDIIRKFMEKTTSKTPYFELAKILDRHRSSVYKRVKKLQDEVKKQHVRWNKKKIRRFLKYCLKITQNSEIEDLKDKQFSQQEWLKLSKKMRIPVSKLQFAWSRTIHPRVFIEKSVSFKRIKNRVIEILTDKEEDDWRNVKWGEIADSFEGFTPYKLNTLFKRMVQVHVPKEKQQNLKDCLEYFSEFNVERRFRTHLLQKIEVDSVKERE